MLPQQRRSRRSVMHCPFFARVKSICRLCERWLRRVCRVRRMWAPQTHAPYRILNRLAIASRYSPLPTALVS